MGKAMRLKWGDSTATKRRVAILCLFAAHLLAGVSLGAFIWLGGYNSVPSLPVRFFVGLIFAQASLLGIWAGFGRSPWWLRSSGLALGAGYLGVGGCIGVHEPNWLSFCLFTSTSIMVTILLIIFRCAGFSIRLRTIEDYDRAGHQIGIRHLLLLTAVVAVMLGVGRQLSFGRFDIYPLPTIIFVYLAFVLTSCVLVGILSAWSMLREKWIVFRGAILLVVAAAAGWAVAQTITETLTFWLVVFPIQAVVLIASLLVVRFCGYRLMRFPRRQSKNE